VTRLLGLDVGNRRIGVAVSDELGIIATPVGYVERGPADRTEIRALVQRFGASALVAGIPRSMSGQEGMQAKDVRTYAKQLANDLELPLQFYDERLTTVMAERSLISSGRSRAQRKHEIDATAAAIMLQGYLDANAARG
jgi:putative Holliday junction resolvase